MVSIKILANAVAALLLGAAACGCTTRSRQGGAGALETNVKDFGYILLRDYKYVEHQFRIANPSSHALHLVDLSRSCTCTEASLSSRVVEPGESASLTLRVRVSNALQEQQVFATVRTDDPRRSVLNYSMKYIGLPDMFIDHPEITINLGDLEPKDVIESMSAKIIHNVGDDAECNHKIFFHGPSGLRITETGGETNRLGAYICCSRYFSLIVPKDFVARNLGQRYQCAVEVGSDRKAGFSLDIRKPRWVEVSPLRLAFDDAKGGETSKGFVVRVLRPGLNPSDLSFEAGREGLRFEIKGRSGDELKVAAILDWDRIRPDQGFGLVSVKYKAMTIFSLPWHAPIVRRVEASGGRSDHGAVGGGEP